MASNSAQLEFLGFLIGLKYPCPEGVAEPIEVSVWCFFAVLQTLAYFLGRAVRDGVHHFLNLGDGRETGVWNQIIAVRVSR